VRHLGPGQLRPEINSPDKIFGDLLGNSALKYFFSSKISWHAICSCWGIIVIRGEMMIGIFLKGILAVTVRPVQIQSEITASPTPP